ncbi:MAG: phosphoglycerate kinase [Patescibacteria group bacterium]
MTTSRYLSETNFDFSNKTVLVRIDCDVDLRKEKRTWLVDEDFRLKAVLPTIHFLQEKQVKKIILLGHLGRPKGKVVKELSLKPVADWFAKQKVKVDLFENLRFSPKEQENDLGFTKKLAKGADVFVNDALAVSHRRDASIVGLPKILPSFLGLRFESEIKVLSWIRKSIPRPLVFVLGGSKSDKVDYLKFLSDFADYLLVGGKLPLLTDYKNKKMILAKLSKNKRDLSSESIEEFKKVINLAKGIIWAGPMGVYEEEENQKGTFEVAKAITKSQAFKVACGGDTHRVISRLNIWDRFDFVSVGGGATLQFLQKQTLPGIEAITCQKF